MGQPGQMRGQLWEAYFKDGWGWDGRRQGERVETGQEGPGESHIHVQWLSLEPEVSVPEQNGLLE